MKVIILLALLLTFTYAGDKKCRALAMSGGGDKGSYEAAVFIELVNLLPTEETSYDVMTGVSAGSMNACGLGVFGSDEADEASQFVFGLWNSLKTDDVFKYWGGGILEGLFQKPGILDTQPLFDFVRAQVGTRTVGKKVSFATCDADNADYFVVDFNASDTLPDDYVTAAIASSSIPGLFPHVDDWVERTLVDGGSLWNVDIPSAVRRCKEIVDNDEDIIVDIILCGANPPIMKSEDDIKRYSALSHLRRSQEIKSFYDTMNKVETGLFLYPNVTFRYLIAPSETLSVGSNPIPLDFSDKHLNRCFDIGKKDAQNAVALGPQVYFQVVQEYRDKIKNNELPDLATMIEERVRMVKDPNYVTMSE